MNDLAITIGLISFPGLIATLLADKLVVHASRWDTFKYFVYTFVFGLLSYVLLQALSSIVSAVGYRLIYLDTDAVLKTWSALTSANATVNFPEVAWATLLAPVVAIVAIVIVNLKLLNKIATYCKISSKYGDENLFSYYLNLSGIEWIYVRDISNNLSYRGQIYSFSEADQLHELVLADVTVYSYDDSSELYKVPMVYLCKPAGTFIIEATPDLVIGDCDEERDQRRLNADPGEGGIDTSFK